jgi:putative ABC transport system permease protein
MPLRNLLRAPRRTLFTVLGIAAAVTTVVGVTGMVDSYVATIDRSQTALVHSSPNRLQVTLGTFVGRNDQLLAAIGTTAGVERTEPAITTAASLMHRGTKIDVVLEVMNAASAIWKPTLIRGTFAAGDPGIVITTKAADDLGVKVGDTIVVRHPRRVGEQQLRLIDTPLRIAALDANPIRVYAYMDTSQAALFGLAGATNLVNAEPAPGTDSDTLKRALLQLSGVASAERVAAASEAITVALDDYTSVLRVVEGVALALALLIAFNSASIAADERAREHATMFAFGVPLRSVLRNAMVEGGIAGLFATAVGVGIGLLLVTYIVTVTTPRVAPDLGAIVSVSAGTIILAAVLGIVATAVAPLMTARKMSRMNVPSTLRVVE